MKLDNVKLNNIICKWVEKNFGMSEVEDPSWDIGELADHIAEQYDKPLEEKAEPYELTLLVRQDMSLKELGVLHNIIMKHFENGDSWKRWENNGIKKLFYSIKGETYAGYFWAEGSLKNTEKLALVKVLDTNPYILRYLLVKPR